MVGFYEATLGILVLAAAVLYFVVARLQARRPVRAEARAPLRGFIVWWTGLGLVELATLLFIAGPRLSLGGVGTRVVLYGSLSTSLVAFGGLVYYLLYLYTGRRASIAAATGFYAGFFLFMVWFVESYALHATAGVWGVEALFQHGAAPAWARLLAGLGLVLPPLVAALAYFLLFFRTTDRTARYRIVLVSGGFVLWFGFILLGIVSRAVTGETRGPTDHLTSQMLGLLSAVLVLLAYDPPRRVQERLGLRPIDSMAVDRHDVFRAPPRLQSRLPPPARS